MMQLDTVPRDRVIVSEGFRLKAETVVSIGALLIRQSLTTQFPEDCLRLSVFVCQESDFGKFQPDHPTLYIHLFEPLPLTSIKGNVTVPAEKLLNCTEGVRMETNLQTILVAETQEIRFDLERTKHSCSVWFKCMAIQPSSLIPKEKIEEFFERIPKR
jgi:hypothetical protein